MLKPISTNTNPNFGTKYCWIPKCKARCCSNAPLPKHYLDHLSIRSKAKRTIYAAIPAPPNNPYCKEALIAVTKKPLEEYAIKAGKTKDGKTVWTVNTSDIFNEPDNYCPFIDEHARCGIYKQRPPICRDFGVVKGYECDLQLSLKDYIKENIKFHWKVIKSVLGIK